MAKDPVCGMDVDESTGLKLTKDNRAYFFCSGHCLKKFARENSINEKDIALCPSPAGTKWYKDKVIIVGSILAFLCGAAYFKPPLEPFRDALFMYFRRIWWALALGFILGGIIDHFVPREYISHILARPKKRTIFYSVILGFFMSACSHGILALSIQLHKKGASNPAVIAFLLASPWANLTFTIMLLAFFGLKALYIILCAIVIAVITGLIYQVLDSKGLIEVNKNTAKIEGGFSVVADIKKRAGNYKFSINDIKGVWKGSVALAKMVLWWLLIGLGIAGFAAAYVPSSIFQNYMGPTVMGLLTTLLVATIIEVCSEGTIPLAFEIFRQTAAFGNAFVFLMAGVVTDYTEIGLLYFNVGKKVAIWLPVITVPQVILLGILANRLF